ncbi:MAG: TetR/AcrR family transcriptional regulator [Eggerthellaceae bacterium]|nr:TetR/AcrR family transcriptional regulator [Eggerthellaceae bacterium]
MEALREKRDLRVEKTLDAIRETFESMLVEMPYEKITVTALCARARINKKTFYRYYSALDDLLQELLSDYIDPYVEQTFGMFFPKDVEDVTKAFLEYCASLGDVFDKIVLSSSHEKILARFIKGIEAERYEKSVPPPGWTEDEWHLYMISVTSAQLKIYQQWVQDGRSVPLDRMIDIACSVICEGANLK